MSSAEARLARMGIQLPDVPKPVAAYVPGVRVGNLIFTSGQIPLRAGEVAYRGKVGRDLSVEEGYQAARLCAVNCLAVVKSLAGDLDRVERVVKVTGFVNCLPDFTDQPKVLNGASELLKEVFGEAGQHARAAVGSSALPLDAATEVELVVALRE